jgi:hypothetical protein
MSALVSIQVPRPYLLGDGDYETVVTVEGVRSERTGEWMWHARWGDVDGNQCGVLGCFDRFEDAIRVADAFAALQKELR